MIDFYIHTYDDNPERVISEIKRFHRDSRIILISDGGKQDYSLPNFHKFDERLKDKPNTKWITRWFDLTRQYASKIIIKVDPDSHVHREFRIPFPTASFFGSVYWRSSAKDLKFIHGSGQFIRPNFIDTIYSQVEYPVYGGTDYRYRGQSLLSVDKVLGHLALKNKIPLISYPEVSGYCPTTTNNLKYAITHENKVM